MLNLAGGGKTRVRRAQKGEIEHVADSLPLAALNEQILEACVRQGEGDDDNSAVIREIRRRRDPAI